MQCLNPVFAVRAGVNPLTGKQIISFDPKRVHAATVDNFLALPCGKCDACLATKRYMWSVRLRLEAETCKSSFITLTYANENLPFDNLPSKVDIQKFVKRLRQVYRDYGITIDKKIRYFIASELGDRYKRPHYHGIIYGLDMLDNAWRPYVVKFVDGRPLYSSKVLEEIWSKGWVSVDRVNPRTIGYITSYINGEAQCWHLQSQGLGTTRFLDFDLVPDSRGYNHLRPVSLNADAYQVIDYGLVLPNSDFTFQNVPRGTFLDTYIERFDNPLYKSIKEKLSEDVKNRLVKLGALDDLASHLKTNWAQIKSKRKLNNEEIVCNS